MSTETTPSDDGLARSAGILAAGNLVSRVLGLVREMMIAALFGATGEVSAFRIAAQVPTLLYDFLVGGISAARWCPCWPPTKPLTCRSTWCTTGGGGPRSGCGASSTWWSKDCGPTRACAEGRVLPRRGRTDGNRGGW